MPHKTPSLEIKGAAQSKPDRPVPVPSRRVAAPHSHATVTSSSRSSKAPAGAKPPACLKPIQKDAIPPPPLLPSEPTTTAPKSVAESLEFESMPAQIGDDLEDLVQRLQQWPFPTPDPTAAVPHPIIPLKLTDLIRALDYGSVVGKTPVILDRSGKVDLFFAYRHCTIVECKPLVLNVFMHKSMLPVEAAQVIADKLRGAMEGGSYFLLRMTDSAPNLQKLATAATLDGTATGAWFPYPELLDPHLVKSAATVAQLDVLQHPGHVRKPHEVPLFPRPGFQVIATSKFEAEDAVEFLTNSLGLSKCQIFDVVEPSA
ncbi:hypothetical protein BC828DRAFT_392133 [Blastocladiella britannica]|nr:hypothetical protein BC828DRAFT_392133 [Blastocladiella britannica]